MTVKNDILKDFYYGNLVPNEKCFVRNSQFGCAAKNASDAEELLRSMLNEEGITAFDKLLSAQMAMNAITAEELYIDGFKTGAKIAMAVFDDEQGDIKSVLE